MDANFLHNLGTQYWGFEFPTLVPVGQCAQTGMTEETANRAPLALNLSTVRLWSCGPKQEDITLYIKNYVNAVDFQEPRSILFCQQHLMPLFLPSICIILSNDQIYGLGEILVVRFGR